MFLFFNSGNKENAIQPGIKASYKRISDYLFNVLNYSNDTKSQTQLYKSQTEHWHADIKHVYLMTDATLLQPEV